MRRQEVYSYFIEHGHYQAAMDPGPDYVAIEDRNRVDPGFGNLISSEVDDGTGLHMPVLDIDFAAELVPSRTPGHFHLYLDKPMTWGTYRNLLRALADAGVIEPGYASASIERGATFVRKPGVPKRGTARYW